MHLRSGWKCLEISFIVLPEASSLLFIILSHLHFLWASSLFSLASWRSSLGPEIVYIDLHLSLLRSWCGCSMSEGANDSACHPFTPCASSIGSLDSRDIL